MSGPRTIEPQGSVIMPGNYYADVQQRLDAHDAEMEELRADLRREQDEHAITRARLGDALAKVSAYARKHGDMAIELLELETLLDHFDQCGFTEGGDWRNDFNCPRCEDRLRMPEHEFCTKCENDIEAAMEDRAS